MEKKNFTQRVIVPVVIVVAIMVVSAVAYLHLTWRISVDNPVRPIVTFVAAAFFFCSIGFGTLVIYPMAFFRGANLGERILACMITPVLWNIKEMVRVSEFFTLPETLYYGLNTAFLLSVFGAIGQMGLCELICRRRLNKHSQEPVRVLSPAPVISILVGVGALYVFLLWGLGVHFFYIYIQGYRALFV